MVRTLGLTVEGLTIDRGERTILRDLSFHVPFGVALTVTGLNGAGKSTLLRGLAGLLPLTAGRIALQRSDSAATDIPVAEQAHYLGHANGLKLSLTARDNLAFSAAWAGTGGTTSDDALETVGLRLLADFPVQLFSAGQRRRVALARLLAAHRTLWILDEPATALDLQSEAVLTRVMRAHLDAGGLIIAAIHAALDVPARILRLGAP